jgi:DNA topoisomerase IA
VAMAAKKLEDVVAEGESEEELDPLMKKIKESEDKIKRIKQQNQEKKGEDGFSLDKLMIAIIKEFNLSMKEI